MKKVEIYSTPTCHFCHMAKDFFATNNVAFNDYNVASDTAKRAEMMERSGQLGVPVIVIDDKDLVIGFDQRKIANLLEIAG
ncbi:MAG: glutaredoxin domain-containing protein [Patescibacteria group bacterium]